MLRRIENNRGFVKLIILIVVILLVLGYLGFNLRDIINSQTFQENWDFIKEIAVKLWNSVLRAPVLFIWNFALKPLFATLGS